MAGKKIQELRKRVGIWLRVSTDDQAKGESPQHHEARARQYAQAKEWEVVEVYHLEAVSGKAVMGHAEARRMMRDIERSHISGLIFSKLARLGRNTRELLEFADYFQTHEADLISIQEAIDTSSPAGRLFYTMIAGMAHWEREEIGSRVSASVPIRAKLGKSLGGRAPFGYKWTPEKKLVADPETAPIRKMVYELFLEHRRKSRVAAILNKAGYRGPLGNLFDATGIERILVNPIAKGSRRMNYVKHDADDRIQFKPESDWIFVEVEPILPAELWDQCNQILNGQKAKRKPTARKPVHLFGGLTLCECGGKMYVRSNSPKYVCQACKNKIPVTDLEALFHDQLTPYNLTPREVADHLSKAHEGLAEKESRIELQKKEQARVKSEMDRLMELFMGGEIPSKGFGARYNPLNERFDQMEEGISQLSEEVASIKSNIVTQSQVLAQARNLYERWPKLTHEQKRKAVDAVLREITIGHETIHFDMVFLPNDSDPGPETDESGDPTDNDPEPPRPRKSPPSTSKNSNSYDFLKDMTKGSQHVTGLPNDSSFKVGA